MQINPVNLTNQTKLIKDYRNEKQGIMQFFDYGLSAEDMTMRLDDLKKYTYDRERLAQVLRELNINWGAPKVTLDNIERLKNKESVVVVGGQQTGLLTGPMYTINKIISIIQYARQQESELNVPVIPVFWMAGEDHDFDEVNHIYLSSEDGMKKHATKQFIHEKKPLSEVTLDKEETKNWINSVFGELQETNYTKDLYDTILKFIEEVDTYVDFFAKVLFYLFDEEGLILIDSGNKLIRKVESDYFIKIINQQAKISSGVYKAHQMLKENNYQVDINLTPSDGHLFYHVNGERILLTRLETGEWGGKNNELKLTTDELVNIAKEEPEKLSNNVVTRTLMQELLLPTLAFVGGPGEIGYWAAFKPAFHSLGLKVPPVVPRLSITYVTSTIVKLSEKHSLSCEEVVNNGVKKSKDLWLASKTNPQIEKTVSEIKDKVSAVHEPLRQIATNIQDDLSALADKNLEYIFNDIDFLEKRIIKTIEERYSKEIDEYNIVNKHLHPFGGLQERIWNPIYFINHYGRNFLKQTINAPLSFTEDHYFIYL